MTTPQISSTVGHATCRRVLARLRRGRSEQHGGDRERHEADVDVERQRDEISATIRSA